MSSPTRKGSPFQDVGSVFPGEVDLCAVKPGETVSRALRLMLTNRYSQLPVIEHGRVRGFVSLRSVAKHLVDFPELRVNDVPVEDVMERLPKVTVEDPLDLVLAHLDRCDAVLVESEHGPQAIATASDVLKYFNRVARPFVLLREIELSLRNLISSCAPGSQLNECIDRALAKKYEELRRPNELAEMSFEDYRSIVANKENWPLFAGTLGQNRTLASVKLKRVGAIRNDLFHFRGGVSVEDHQSLVSVRDWLLDKTQQGRRGKADE